MIDDVGRDTDIALDVVGEHGVAAVGIARAPGESIAGMKALNRMVDGTNLPRISEERLDEIVHRDSLALLFREGLPEPAR